MKTILDLPGLTLQTSLDELLADGLELTYDVALYTDEDRFQWLTTLHKGYGVTILTGPWGAGYWGLVSPEVVVKVVPDGVIFTDRYDTYQWTLIQQGLTLTEAKQVIAKPPKTARSSKWEAWQVALKESQGVWCALDDATPFIDEEFPVTLLTEQQGINFLNQAAEMRQFLALDWEWDEKSLEPLGISIATAEDQFYVPVRSDNGSSALPEAFQSFSIRGRGVLHGGRADYGSQLSRGGVERLYRDGHALDDTMIMAYMAGYSDLKLKNLTRALLNREPIEYPGSLTDMPLDKVARYAGGDARNTYDLYVKLIGELLEKNQLDLYNSHERPLVPLITSMETQGQPVDLVETKRLYLEYATLEEAMRRAVLENYGRDLKTVPKKKANAHLPQHDGDMAARQLIMDFGHNDPGTIDQRVISLNPDGIVDLILFYRQHRTIRRNLGKLLLFAYVGRTGKVEKLSTTNKKDRERYYYERALNQRLDLSDGDYRTHPRFNQAGGMDKDNPKAAPRTGRLSSAGPNIQQWSRRVRSIFVAPRGYKFFSYDYSQLELRIAAAISGDETMMATFTSDPPGDPHRELQDKIIEMTGVDVGRVPAKTGNFEKGYGGGDQQLVAILAKQRAHITLAEAQAIDKAWRARHPGYIKWVGVCAVRARGRGYSETERGRRRYIPELTSRDPTFRAKAERQAANAEVQGFAADIVKEAMRDLEPVMTKHGAHISMQVHDEINGWVPDGADHEEFERDVKEVMEGVELPREIRLAVGGRIADNWGEAH